MGLVTLENPAGESVEEGPAEGPERGPAEESREGGAGDQKRNLSRGQLGVGLRLEPVPSRQIGYS